MPAGTRVLVIDDEVLLLDMLADFLREQGYEVCPSDDAGTAIDHIKTGTIDIAVIDVGAHGLRVAREATTRNIPCILMSGRPVIFEIGGLGEVMRKPFRFDALSELIEAIVAKYRSGALPGADPIASDNGRRSS